MKLIGSIGAAVFMLLFAIPSFASQFSGLTVTQIVIQDDQGKAWSAPEQITPLMAVKPGDTFSGAAIREGISYLYLTSRFKDVRVDGFPDNGGVKLVYTLVPITLVQEIEIRGNHVMSTSRIMDTLRGINGRELREDKFPDYRTGILTLYQSDGYYGAAVDFKIEQLKEPHHVILRIYITEPKRTVIADVNFSGNAVFTKKQLLKVMKSKPGKPLRTDVLFDQDMAAILQKYTEAGYPTAKPGPVNISFRDEMAYVLVAGKEGPKVTVHLSGNHAFSDKEIRKQVLIWSEHDISDPIIDSSVDKIKNLYKDSGYDNVKLTLKKTEAPGMADLFFDIQEGRRITAAYGRAGDRAASLTAT